MDQLWHHATFWLPYDQEKHLTSNILVHKDLAMNMTYIYIPPPPSSHCQTSCGIIQRFGSHIAAGAEKPNIYYLRAQRFSYEYHSIYMCTLYNILEYCIYQTNIRNCHAFQQQIENIKEKGSEILPFLLQTLWQSQSSHSF